MSDKKNSRQRLGEYGEKIAVKHLIDNGYDILRRNFRFGRFGEIDIVAKKKSYICFIEVKTRSSDIFGRPSESVNLKKQQKMKKLALLYIKEFNLEFYNIRFDIIEVIIEIIREQYSIKSVSFIENAF